MFTTSSAERSASDPWGAPTPSLTDSRTWTAAVAQIAPSNDPWAAHIEEHRAANEARNARLRAEAAAEATRYPGAYGSRFD